MISKSLYLAGQETWSVPGLAQSSSWSLGTRIVVLESQMLLNFSPLEGAGGRRRAGFPWGCSLLCHPGGFGDVPRWVLAPHTSHGAQSAGRQLSVSENFKRKIVKFNIWHMSAGVPARGEARAFPPVQNSAFISVTYRNTLCSPRHLLV